MTAALAARRRLLAPSSQAGDDLKCLLSEVKPTNAVDARMAKSGPGAELAALIPSSKGQRLTWPCSAEG
jgi:hypothetical protein